LLSKKTIGSGERNFFRQDGQVAVLRFSDGLSGSHTSESSINSLLLASFDFSLQVGHEAFLT